MEKKGVNGDKEEWNERQREQNRCDAKQPLAN